MPFNKHNACMATHNGWVDIDHSNFRAINCVTKKIDSEILDSKFYKDKENIFWPKVTKIDNYKSKHGDALEYYETEYIHNILRYPEFTPLQFKEALLFICDVCEYCKKAGYWLRTHLWNLTFVKGHLYIIDMRDFEILRNQSWLVIFTGHFRSELDNHCPVHTSKFISNYDYIYNKLMKCPNDLQKIREIINEINIIKISNGVWTSYHGERSDFIKKHKGELNEELCKQIKCFKGGSVDDTKSVNLFKSIEKIKPKNIIEVGCNNGLYCFASSSYCNTIGIDYDINAINEANNLNKKLKAKCSFLHYNLLDENALAKTYGLNGAYGTVIERFKSEMLIAPAIIHNLFIQCKSTDKIIEIFNKFAEKYMLIEQIPGTVPENNLILSLKKYNWEIVEQIPSCPNPRKWLICKKLLKSLVI